MAFLEHRPKQTLFQYCSVDGFLGILRSKRLWFSDLASTNDPREIQLGYEKIIEALRSVRHDEYKGEKGFFLSILAGRIATTHENFQAFCCCFSMAPDELPMWGAYGANYEGLAIGFRPTAVFGIPARVQKVRYLDENTITDFRELVLDIAARYEANHSPDDLNYRLDASVSAFSAMTALKHSTWSYEREIRLVHMQPIRLPDKKDDPIFSHTGVLPDGQPVEWSKPKERISGTTSVNYLEFPYGRFRSGSFDPAQAIEKIIVGPNCPLSQNDVTAKMREYGFRNFEVTTSICQIR